ncbi:MAG: LacI family DNA-binding transcriptional regulator, partial [Pseudomonadota bacterium]
MATSTPPPRKRLADVARALGVSVATVSNAFNRPDQLSPALRKLVLERAEDLGYRGPGIEGRLLRTGHAGSIALYIPEPMTYLLEDAFVRTFMGALMNACQERQIGLLLLPAVPHAKSDRPRPPAALDVAAVDAIIFYGLAGDDPVIQRAVDRGRPVVGIDMLEKEGVISIGVDDVGGARAAATQLIQKGHRQFGVISLPTSRRRTDRAGT